MPQDNATALGPLTERAAIGVPLDQLRPKSFNCPQDPNLYPTHPQQTAKDYHYHRQASYRPPLLDARDPECILSTLYDRRPTARRHDRMSPTREAQAIARAEETGRRIPCILGAVYHRYIISDTYIDACGNYYRGAKQVEFLAHEEHDGHLFSLGRVTYPLEGGMPGETFVGNTWAVPHGDFYLLAHLLPGDMDRIERGRAQARRTHILDAAGRLFRVR